MDVKGAVICFQKYVLGRERTSTYLTPGGPVCLGYMGRVDVQKVRKFKDFVAIASEHGAEYACTRKQLLVYQIDKEFDQSVDIVELGVDCPNDGRAPFRGGPDREFFALDCCSVLNISKELQSRPLRTVASWLNDRLKHVRDGVRGRGMDLEFAIVGLLGSEDLCLITLSNHFAAISEVLSEIQKMTHTEGAETAALVDNTHSMLMMDCTADNCDWGDANAQLFFSTRSKEGISYLTSVYNQLKADNPDSEDDISFEGCYGEYDAVIRCPARLLRAGFYRGENGALSYDNPAYQNAVYQSQTIVHPFGCGHLPGAETETAGREVPPPDTALDDAMKRDMKEITRNILGTEVDEYQELTYIRLALYRLLKDYRRMMAFPFNACLHSDLTLQFHTAVNAIVKASRSHSGSRPIGPESMLINNFNIQFDEIIDTLNSAMMTIGQVDRFYFNEQPSYLQNTGSYHKVLLAYYGFIKDVLRLLYSVERDAGNRQPVVVPLLCFGLTPIVYSQSFPSYVRGDDGAEAPAKLLCIKLPYQALANPPKYLGILVHEVFHYLDFPQTGSWNKLLVTCLVRVSLCEFTSVLAAGLLDASKEKNYSSVFYHNYSMLVNAAAERITEDLFALDARLHGTDPDNLKNKLFQFLSFQRSPKTKSYQFYYQIWSNLRLQFASGDEDEDIKKLFALDKTDGLEEEFASRVRAVTDFRPFQYLLSSCYNALAEVTSDLFDVGTVLYGRNKEVWAKQFFWQIYSTRSDLLLGCGTVSPSVEQPEHGLLPFNGIRFGIFMDYCLGLKGSGVERINRFADVLREWCADASEKDRFDKVQSTFRGDYKVYTAYSTLYTDYEQKFLDTVCAAMDSLEHSGECAGIIKKASAFYWRYSEIMDDLRRGKGEAQELEERRFDLCVEVIEAYQHQDSIQALTEFPPAAPSPASPRARVPDSAVLSRPKHPLRGFAEYPAELSWAVSSACQKMSVGGRVPLLWYRGQSNKHKTTLPGTLRKERQGADGSFLTRFRQELHLARTQILPQGTDFTQAEWLAYLQHNEFPTNILDFSESFYPALYFAIQLWIDKPEELPKYDSHIALLNPILFNLAMRALDESKKAASGDRPAMNMLKEYLECGTVTGGVYLQLPLFSRDEEGTEEDYQFYYSWNKAADDNGSPQRPRAALIPKNSERMRRQSGQFVFYDLRTKQAGQAEQVSLENLCEEYRELVEEEGLPHIPFLFEININRFAHKSFIDYAKAIGLRKYHVYPELDKLAKDVKQLVGEQGTNLP